MELAQTRVGWRHAVVAATAVAVTLFASSAIALLAGAAIALTIENPAPRSTARLSKKLLPLAVVGLGFGMNLGAVALAGVRGFGYTVVTIGASFALGALVARWLALRGKTGLLITVGTAICGGSAIAAAAPAVGAEEREVTIALATVFLLNSVALLVTPPIGHAVGLGQASFGLWAALAVHDTSSVVGAALQFGPRALEVATSVKLARALWIVPVTVALAALERRAGRGAERAPAPRPWFIAGFVVAAAIATFLPPVRPVAHALAFAAQRALVLTLFLIGAGLSRPALREVGPRPFAHGLVLWIAMGTVTLAAVRAGWIS
jgi:uncharacterized integral membrane protein (TIGR00698 family)